MTAVTDKPRLSRKHALELLKQMVRVRRFEDKCAELYSQEKIRGFLHLYDGEEAVAVGVIPVLEKRDRRRRDLSRARACARARRVDERGDRGDVRQAGGLQRRPRRLDAPVRPRTNFYGGNAIVGGGLPLAVGLALADHMRGEDIVTACFFGEGAVAEGEFHESLNLAALWGLPVLFVCENNLYAMGTALAISESETDIQRKAASYRIASEAVDGMDVVAVEAAARRADRRGPRERHALFPRMPHLSLARPFDVRRSALPRQEPRSKPGGTRNRSCASRAGSKPTG